MRQEWQGFKKGKWTNKIDVKDFIKSNIKSYSEDESFLVGTTEKTNKVWSKCEELIKEEISKGVLDIDTENVSGVDNFKPGYIDIDNEVIVGLQTDAPLKRIVNPFGGIRMVDKSLKSYNYTLNKNVNKYFKKYRKTHNEGVFDVYTEEILKARKAGILTGLPDAYGRGRIIGDYRRVALYGTDFLKQEKIKDLSNITGPMSDSVMRLREEVNEQIRAIEEITSMAKGYGFDITVPAKNASEAFQWLYFGYLAAIKENNGAAMSLGRVSSFLDIYIERDIENGILNEETAQELVDQFVIKLRLVRHLRTPEYDSLFAGDPTWVTESIGGVSEEGIPYVTKNSYRFLHTLSNLAPSPEPNLTVLWSEKLPEAFKRYCADVSIKTDSIQYENDDLMRKIYGDDYAIACCVSAMQIGKQMQFFGARSNIAKALLYAINGGVDEINGEKIFDGIDPITDEYLDYDKVLSNYEKTLDKTAALYTDTMNTIHYMHDKYAYEKSQMALHDTNVDRLMAFGMAGLSVAADSLSAIKYAKVKPIRNENGIVEDFEIDGDYPKYGNDDDRVDSIATMITEKFYNELCKHPLYRDAKHTLSVLTITSNVVYGKKTGTTPDGRKKGEPFAPGANPMHGRDKSGALASLNSVAKIKYENCCEDGISNTFSISKSALGDDPKGNLANIIDGYFNSGGHHLNINALPKEMLIDAMDNPEKYPLLTIRVSGYAVHFNRLSREQQKEVINRTFHEEI